MYHIILMIVVVIGVMLGDNSVPDQTTVLVKTRKPWTTQAVGIIITITTIVELLIVVVILAIF